MSVEEKLELLMQEVCQSRREVDEKLESTLAEVSEVNASREDVTGCSQKDWEHQLPVPQKRPRASVQIQLRCRRSNQLCPYGIGKSEVICTGGKGIAEESGV